MQVSSVHCAEVNRPCNRERLLDTCTLRSLSVHDVFRSVHAHCYRVTHQSDGINERIICRQQYPDIICRQQYPHDYFTYILNRLGIRPWENRNTCQIFVHIVSGDPFSIFLFSNQFRWTFFYSNLEVWIPPCDHSSIRDHFLLRGRIQWCATWLHAITIRDGTFLFLDANHGNFFVLESTFNHWWIGS